MHKLCSIMRNMPNQNLLPDKKNTLDLLRKRVLLVEKNKDFKPQRFPLLVLFF